MNLDDTIDLSLSLIGLCAIGFVFTFALHFLFEILDARGRARGARIWAEMLKNSSGPRRDAGITLMRRLQHQRSKLSVHKQKAGE